MIELRIVLSPHTVTPAERSLYDLEAYYRVEPAAGAPGAWTAAGATPVALSGETVITIPTGVGRYHVAVRLKRRSDGFVLPGYVDADAAHLWPSVSRKLITCDEDDLVNERITLTAAPWRRTSETTSAIPLTVSGDALDAALETVVEVRRKDGLEPWRVVEVLAAAATETTYEPTGSASGTPSDLDEIGNVLQFRAYQILADESQRADSNLVEIVAGTPPVADARGSITAGFSGLVLTPARLEVAWTPIGDPPRVAPAEGAIHLVSAAIVPAGQTFTPLAFPATSVPEANGLLHIDQAGLADGDLVRVEVWRSTVWLDGAEAFVPGWPGDLSRRTVLEIPVTFSAGNPPPPAPGNPFIEASPFGVRFRLVTTIGGADASQIHFQVRYMNPSTGVETWSDFGAPISIADGIGLGTEVSVLIPNPQPLTGYGLTGWRARQSRIGPTGARLFSTALSWGQ